MIHVIATTAAGKVRGSFDGKVCRFYGVPYAAPPIGELRFAAPAPRVPWTGERDATRKAPNAPQSSRIFPNVDVTPLVEGWHKGDDYLVANVWTPDVKAKGLPVLVFFHGGAWLAGAGDSPAYDGTSFARNGVVCITINYRLGAEGLLPLAGGPSNIFLRDMIAALKWIQHNAQAFGGDARNVTAFGLSAGASSVSSLVGSREAKGLFRRAIAQSGHGSMWQTRAASRVLVDRIADVLGAPPSVEGFRGKSIEEIVLATEKVLQPGYPLDLRDANGRCPTYGVLKLLPLMGDDLVPEASVSALAAGEGATIDLLIGSTAEEMNLYLAPAGISDIEDPARVTSMLEAVTCDATAILEDYGLGRIRAGAAYTNALSDLVFRDPVRQFALAHKGRAHVYEFGWRSPAMDGRLGACHALDTPFIFNTLGSCTGRNGLVGERPPQDLADHIHRIWVRFATDGAIPWPEFHSTSRQVYRLDKGETIREEEMPAAKYRS